MGAGLRKPGRGSANSDNSEARGELHRFLQLAPTRSSLSAAPPPKGNRWSVLWAAATAEAGGQRPVSVQRLREPGWGQRGPQGRQRTERPRARTMCAQLLAARNQHPSCSPRRCSLPSDSAAQKANGKGASFKVHINLVLVGYSLAAPTAVPKRIVLTTQLDLLAKCSAFTSPG